MKNGIIAVLLIGLLVSGYFNYRDSKEIKIKAGKDSLKLTFFGVDRIRDSLGIANGKPSIYAQVGSIESPITVCQNPDILIGPCQFVKQPITPDPGVQPKLDEILTVLLQKYKNIVIGATINHGSSLPDSTHPSR